MVRRIDFIRNVGRFENVGAGAQLPFEKLTLIYAENARGKSTIAAIMRSLASGRADLIQERARLGAAQPPQIVIDTGAAPAAVFQQGAWNRTSPEIVVFDDTFVSENICSGIEVGTTQRQNLHELIVGAQGIALAQALQTEVDRIEVHNRNLREREAAVSVLARGPLSVDNFCALTPVADIQRLIDEADRRLAAARDAGRIAGRSTFQALALPRIDLNQLRSLLNKGLPELEASALARVQEHMTRLGRGSEAWVGRGLEYVGRLSSEGYEECPFCAQDLASSPLLIHYRGYFSHTYNALKNEIADAWNAFRSAQAGDVPAAFERSIRETVEAQSFWKTFAEVPAIEVDTVAIALTWKAAREHIEGLLEAKASNPLEVPAVLAIVESAVNEYNAQCDRIRDLSEQLAAINPQLDTVKEQARDANIAALTSDLANLRASQARFLPANVAACDAYLVEKTAKAATEQRRANARAALDQHRQAAFPAYGVMINDFLSRFNVSFRVGPIDAVNNRAGSSANYTLLIDGHVVPLAAEVGESSFRNTLSAGDRNTLALAFFFASLQHDPLRSQKVVVIDDPMTSLDDHRTLHTLQEMERLLRDVVSIIVLSHSKPFLLGVWNKCQQIQKTALQVLRAGTGSTFAAWDVNAAMIGEHDRRYAGAVSYIANPDPANERRVAESLRPMLEAFCRVSYASDFPPETMLGVFHRQCVQRLGTPTEIMNTANSQELRALLDFANRYHHDINPAYATELINEAELTDFTKRTLRFMKRA